MLKKPSNDPSKYPAYSQYAFRASKEEIEGLQEDMNQLYTKFNKGRDPQDPKGRRAVKLGDIALEALRIGIETLKKRSKWDFSEK